MARRSHSPWTPFIIFCIVRVLLEQAVDLGHRGAGADGDPLPAAAVEDVRVDGPPRRRPDVLNGGRKKRIAIGSGTSVAEINRLLKQYRTMQKMMKGVQGKWLRRAMGSGGQARA